MTYLDPFLSLAKRILFSSKMLLSLIREAQAPIREQDVSLIERMYFPGPFQIRYGTVVTNCPLKMYSCPAPGHGLTVQPTSVFVLNARPSEPQRMRC